MTAHAPRCRPKQRSHGRGCKSCSGQGKGGALEDKVFDGRDEHGIVVLDDVPRLGDSQVVGALLDDHRAEDVRPRLGLLLVVLQHLLEADALQGVHLQGCSADALKSVGAALPLPA